MDHSPGKKHDFECDIEYVPAEFLAGLYRHLTNDEKEDEMRDCFRKIKNDMPNLESLTNFISRKYFDDQDIVIDYGDLWYALAETHNNLIVKCPGVDDQTFDKQWQRIDDALTRPDKEQFQGYMQEQHGTELLTFIQKM